MYEVRVRSDTALDVRPQCGERREDRLLAEESGEGSGAGILRGTVSV